MTFLLLVKVEACSVEYMMNTFNNDIFGDISVCKICLSLVKNLYPTEGFQFPKKPWENDCPPSLTFSPENTKYDPMLVCFKIDVKHRHVTCSHPAHQKSATEDDMGSWSPYNRIPFTQNCNWTFHPKLSTNGHHKFHCNPAEWWIPETMIQHGIYPRSISPKKRFVDFPKTPDICGVFWGWGVFGC